MTPSVAAAGDTSPCDATATRLTMLVNRLLIADFDAAYEQTAIIAVSDNPAVAVPILTINGWILMQRKATGSTTSFNQNWAAYRDGFGVATSDDSYWLGLDKVHRLMQLGNVRLRVEVRERQKQIVARVMLAL